jgi:hypothetical protein
VLLTIPTARSKAESPVTTDAFVRTHIEVRGGLRAVRRRAERCRSPRVRNEHVGKCRLVY